MSGSNLSDSLVGRDVSVRFGGVTALENVTIAVRKNAILGLIGPNGAGKTTLVNVLTGFQKPDTGQIIVHGVDMTRSAPHSIARAGVARTFQAVRLFSGLTVAENIEACAAATGLSRRAARERARGILDWIGLADRAGMMGSALPYGVERRVGIARALAISPDFILLDEPAAGLNEEECDELIETTARIPVDFGCGVLVIEHNMPVIMGVCAAVHVLDGGRTIAEGPTHQVRSDPEVIRAYLGSKRERRRAAKDR
jgi:branched-chain amino acid transport system ATP-binding protein